MTCSVGRFQAPSMVKKKEEMENLTVCFNELLRAGPSLSWSKLYLFSYLLNSVSVEGAMSNV